MAENPSLPRSERVLWAGFTGGIALLALACAIDPDLVYVAWTVPLIALGATQLVRHPLVFFGAVIVSFGMSASFEEGIQPTEVVFGLLYLSYMGYWVTTQLPRRLDEGMRFDLIDKTVLAFLALVPVAAVLGIAFGASPAMAFSEAFNFSLLSLYFPVRDLCDRDRRGVYLILSAFAFFALAAVVRNVITLSAAFNDASYAWEIANGRVPVNEAQLFAGAVTCVIASVTVTTLRYRILMASLGGVFTVGLLLTGYRAYYAAFVLALLLVFLLANRERKRFLLGSSALLLVLGSAAAYLLFGEAFFLLVFGLANRFLSIGTAASADISFLNRFFETRAIWERIMVNPIAGYGLGVEYGFYDAILKATWVKTFAHNSYLMLWHKFGLIGFLLFVGIWPLALWRAWSVYRSPMSSTIWQTGAFVALVMIVAAMPAHLTMASFTTMDTILLVALLTGMASGLFLRHERAAAVRRRYGQR